MTTPAHTDFDSNKPSGTSSPTTFSADTLNQLRALRDLIIAGLVPGFVQSRTTGTGPDANRPQYIRWYSSTLGIGFRWNITWTGNKATTIQEEWTNDSEASWTAVGSAQVNTFDANLNITASTNSGGFVNVLFEVWAKVLQVIADLVSHAAGTGTGVHGLGTMSTQAASAVAITGGSANAMTWGLTTPAAGRSTRMSEEAVGLSQPGTGGTVTIDWNAGGYFYFTAPASAGAAFTIAFSNAPASGIARSIVVEITGGGGRTITYPSGSKHIKGTAPVLTAGSGVDLLTCVTRDGATFRWALGMEDSR